MIQEIISFDSVIKEENNHRYRILIIGGSGSGKTNSLFNLINQQPGINKMKDKGEGFTIKWSVPAKAFPHTCGSKRCDLCLMEKLLIAKADPRTQLNKRSEIALKCRHRNKFTLKCFW